MEAQLVTQGTLQTTEGRALPLERTEVRGSVSGAIADVVVRQVFRNDIEVPIEAVYLFPLPHEASVYRMCFRIADRVVEGVVREKAEARRVYERARAEGRAATLLEEEKPALFTLSVANVAPGVTIEVELAYQEVVAYDDGRWRLVFPMVAPTRYADANAGDASAGPRRAMRTRAPDVSIELAVRGVEEVESLRSPSHAVHTRYTDDGVPVVSLAAGEALPNKDFVLTWRAGDFGVRPWLRFERDEGRAGTFLLLLTPSVPRSHTESVGGDGDVKAVRCGNCGGVIRDLAAIKEIPGLGPVVPCGFCGAILAPGTEVITRATRPRDVLILVDRSASMRGSMPTVRRAVRALLDGLGPGDGAQLMAFDHDRLAFDGDGERFAVISPELVQMAERFLAELAPRGGTELEAAIQRASQAPAREGRTRVVVLITDAAVGNEGRLLRRVPELLGASTRMFVLGVGAAVDRGLVVRLARAGRGTSDVVLPGEADDETLTRFARKVREGGAVLTNITLYWEGAEMVEVYPKAIPDLHGGDPLRIFGRFTHTGMTKLVITAATADGKPYRQELEVGLPERTERKPGITRLWARRRVEDLAERASAGGVEAPSLRAEGTALSLEHNIVGPFTSLVAEDREVSVAKRTVRRCRVVVDGGGPRGALLIERPRVTIGRGSAADLMLSDPKVSTLHCEIRLEDDAWELWDLDSTNGTEVDGRAARRTRIEPGARIRVGHTVLRFELAEGTFEVLPTKRVDVDPLPVEGGEAVADTAGEAARDEAVAARSKGRRREERARAAIMDDELDAPSDDGMRASFSATGAFAAEGLDLPLGGPAPQSRADFGAMAPPPAARMAAPAPRAVGGPPPLGAAPPPPMAAPAAMPPGAMPAPGAPPPAAPPAPGSPPPAAAPAMPSPPPSFGISPMMAPPIAPAAKRGGGIISRIVDKLTGGGGGADEDPFTAEATARDPFEPIVPTASPLPRPPEPPPRPPLGPPPFIGPPPNIMPPTNMPIAPPPRPPPPRPLPPCVACGERVTAAHLACPRCGHLVGTPKPLPPKGFVVSEAYDEAELEWFRARGRGELDLVFLVDETGSMGAYIAEVRKHLLALVDELRASPLCRMLRLGVVSYRDHPPQDHSYASKVLALTDDIETVRRAVERLSASGGGDGPESVTDGLYDLVRLDWRPNAARAVVWFGDAPPHGVEPSGDAFPQGCPCGNHWFTQAESCREMGVAVYAIGCLPGIRSFVGAEAVFRQVAETTRGVYLPLREARLLVPMIVGAASTELDRQRIDEHAAELIAAAEGAFADTTDDERVAWLTRALTARGVRAREVADDPASRDVAPLRFRALTAQDAAGALDRLRFQSRISI